MQPTILVKSTIPLNKWTPYKSWKYPLDLLKSIPQMSEQQIDLNLVQINLCAYYNSDILEMLNNKMVEKGFYLKNRHMLQNLVNASNREKGLIQKINAISKKFDHIFINGIDFIHHKIVKQLKNQKEKIQSQKDSQSSATTSQVKDWINQLNLDGSQNQKDNKAKWISQRQNFIFFLSNISDKLFEYRQGKTQEEINLNKHKIYTQFLIQINKKIQATESFQNLSQSSIPSKNHQKHLLNPYTFYFKNQFKIIKSINLENSSFIPTKNRSPLKLDLRFAQFIYKNDDQVAHEIIAMQLIKYLNKIFDKQHIKEYEIIPEVKGAFYEYVESAKTIAQIKKQHPDLLSYLKFLANTKLFQLDTLQKRFAQTYAGYCIAQLMLEIKDRNNSNIMIREDGTFFHIDLAFIFNAKPGGISFESAPFKMTKQYVKAMGGFESDYFKYFQSLLIQLITKIYESKDQFLYKLGILGSRSKQIRCFNGFDIQKYKNTKIVKSLDDTRQFVENLIDKSYDSWCTRKYDTYQWKTNKIPL